MKKKIMLVSSSGGHWVQMNRLNAAIEGHETIYVTTDPKYRAAVSNSRFLLVPDASRWNKFRVIWLAVTILKHILKVRPDIVISTGAAPGFFALYFAKKIGAKTIWLDSIANVDELSLSGRMVGKYADLWLTQWEHLAVFDGPRFIGAVL